MLPKILIALYPILIFIALVFIFKFFRLRRLFGGRLRIPDVFILFLLFGLYKFSSDLTTLNLTPYLLLVLSSLALFLLLLDLFWFQQFRFRRFFKLFWRLSFFITLFAYIAMVVLRFIN